MRLIDADELKADFIGNRYGAQAIEYVIDQQLTVDAVPVKHGHWIDVNGDGSLWRCSVCGETQCCDSNYCGECGAKMDMAVAYYADNKLIETVVIDERKENE